MKNIKLRYYLRGLGIGVLVTALIMTLAGGKEATLTDAQIKERAVELGMVDANSMVLSDLRTDDVEDAPSVEGDDQPDVEDASDVESMENTDAEQANEETVSTDNADTEQEIEESTGAVESIGAGQEAESTEDVGRGAEGTTDSEESEDTEESKDTEESYATGDIVTLTIRSGANSYSVSKELENMGLVADAGEFDDYLCDNGYAKVVRVGTYKIVIGTSEEEIAKIITGKR